MNNLIGELLHEGMYICWWTMIWNAYVELTWWLYDAVIVVDVVDVVIVVDVVVVVDVVIVVD